jgi:serine/threonine-protein kinase
VVRFAIPVPPSGQTNSLGYSNLSVSRDGRALVYVGQAQGRRQQLMIRRLDEVTARPLPGTEDASNPIFSPDGRWVAFNRSNQLYKVAVDGGAPQLLGTPPGTFNGMTWSSTGVIVVSGNTALYVVPEAGGQPQRFGMADIEGELYRDAPLVLDEHGIVLYSSWPSTSVAGASIAIASLTTGEAQVLDIRGADPLGILDNVLIYVTGTGVIMGAPIDISARRVTGPPVQLQSDVSLNNSTGLASAALSRTGTLFFQSGTQLSRVVIAGADGSRRTILDEPREYGFPRLSPDGNHLALTLGTADHRDIWLHDLEAGTLTRLTTEGTTNERPEWSPDGTRVLYRTDRGVRTSIWWGPADRSADAVPLLSGPRLDVFEAVLSPDGRHIVYQLDTLGADIYYRAVRGDTTPQPVATARSSIETMPRISPDGRWVTFTTNESGRDEVVVQPFPGSGGRVQVSSGGGSEPVWSKDGRRLFYRGEGQIMAATIRTDPSFRVTARDTVFTDRYAFAANPHANYDVLPDGARFIFLEPASEGSMVVVANWRAVLRDRMAEAAAR